jgi:hypothetical protein
MFSPHDLLNTVKAKFPFLQDDGLSSIVMTDDRNTLVSAKLSMSES